MEAVGEVAAEGRQPLYANAPPKPRRLTTTSRDYSPSSDTSPERLPPPQQQQLQGPISGPDDSPANLFRHRMPQERRTPEAYGRSNPRFPKEYEEVYGNNTGVDRGEDVAARHFTPPSDSAALQPPNNRRLSAGSYGGTPRSALPPPPPYVGNHFHQPSATSEPPAADDFLSQYLAATMTKVSPPRASTTTTQPQRPHSEYIAAPPSHHGLPPHEEEHSSGRHFHPHQSQQLPPQRVPRPHSADFLEFERNNPLGEIPMGNQTDAGFQKAGQQMAPRRGGNSQHQQPPRPKSSIGDLRRQQSDDFWSEEVYAQKMRESAYVYDPAAAGSRSQSRGPGAGSAVNHRHQAPSRGLNVSSSHDANQMHGGPFDRFSAAFGQLPPPPAFYQDRSPREEDPNQSSPRSGDGGDRHHQNENQSPRGQYPLQQQLLNSSVGSGSSAQVQSPLLEQQQQQQYLLRQNASFGEDQTRATGAAAAAQYMGYNSHRSEQQQQPERISAGVQRVPIPQFSPNPNSHQQHLLYQQDSRASPFPGPQQQQQQQQQQALLRQAQMSPSHVMSGPQQQQYRQQQQSRPQQPPYIPQQQPPPHSQSSKVTNKMMMLQASAELPAMVPSPSFPPQPTPRKINNNSNSSVAVGGQHTPTMYQNLPPNSKAFSDPRPLTTARLETATPNRFSERFDSDRSADSQLSSEFRRSASARLPKQKHRGSNGGGDYASAMHEESDASKSNSEQVKNTMLSWSC